MSGDHKERVIAGVKVITKPFDAMTAFELGPEAALVMTPLLSRLKDGLQPSDDLAELGPAIMGMASQLTGGKLRALAPKLLARTQVVVNNELVPLVDEAAINKAFSGERAGALFGALVFAAEVSFGAFFAGSVPRG